MCTAFFWGLIGILVLLFMWNPHFLPLLKGVLILYLFAVWATSVYKLWVGNYKGREFIVAPIEERGYDNYCTYETTKKDKVKKMSNDVIKVNLTQASSKNDLLMGYVASLKESGIIIELISENYADNSRKTLVVFTMSANDLYKIPDIIEQQIVMDVVDEEYVTDNVKELAIIVYNDYLE
jgi:hypothetical protein